MLNMLGVIRQAARVRPTNLFFSYIMRQQFSQTRKVPIYTLLFIFRSLEKKNFCDKCF